MADPDNSLAPMPDVDRKEEPVKVVVRCRPLNKKEIKSGNEKIVKVHSEKGSIEVLNPKCPGTAKQFTFDTVYDDSAKQADLYDETFRPLVDSVLMGFNGTIFAYGQTGAGKTYTMEGDANDPEKKGVIPNAFQHIFSHIESSQNQQYLVSASYLEIYQEVVRDLLTSNRKPCELKQGQQGVYAKDITVFVCKNVDELDNVLATGNKNRSVGATNMNQQSSRSHAIFMITIEQCELDDDGSQRNMKIGKLNLVDLAGSERQAKTGAVASCQKTPFSQKMAIYQKTSTSQMMGQRQKESIKINLSLSALGNVISALVEGTSTHIPYRDSKLTRLLSDSLGGNSRTVMVANIGPADYNADETMTTLRYANRAKHIKNSPIVNQDPKDALLKKFQEEISRLKAELAAKEKRRQKKKKTLKIIESDTEVFEDTDLDNEEEILRQKKALLEEEKTAILNDQNLISEERNKLLSQVQAKEEQLKLENEAMEKIKEKIQNMEGKLLSGGKNIIDRTNEQQKQLEQRRKELAEQKCREREILRKLEEEEGNTIEIKETYSTLRQEVEIKSRKLRKLFVRLQSLKREIYEEQEVNSRERQEKEKIQDILMRQLKYTHLVIENFVLPEEKQKVVDRINFDDDENSWYFLPEDAGFLMLSRPISADQKSKRPITEYAKRLWKVTNNPRYRNENIVMVDLDFAVRSTSDYKPPVVNPYMREIMDGIMASEKDLEFDASDPRYTPVKKSARRRVRARTGRRKKDDEDDETNYPTPRGLVPRH